jgi:C4-dicarboxylate transporter DctM subunit
MTVNLAIGFVTPPVAVNLYVASGISGVPVLSIAREALPFIGAFLVGLTIVVLMPALSTWLPKVVMN